MLLETNKKGLEYNINMTMKYVTLQALLEGANNITSFAKGIAIVDGASNYMTSSMVVRLMEYIPSIKKTFEEKADRKVIMVKNISYALGSIKGLIFSYGYDGVNFYISLGLNLVKNFSTTFIIDKLNKLHQVDGLSVAVLIGFICSIPKVAKSFLNKDFIQVILSLLTIASLMGINYIVIKHQKEIKVDYLEREDKLKINFSNIYSLAIMVANTLMKILAGIGIVGIQLNIMMAMAIPIVGFILSTDIEDLGEKIDKYLSLSNGCISGIRQGAERKEYLKGIIKKENFKISALGIILYLISYNILMILGISTNITLYLTLIVSSVIQISYSIKSIKGINKVKNSKIIGGNK